MKVQGVAKRTLQRIPNVAVWRMLTKHFHTSKALKLSIVQRGILI
jgi:hypothetical protein